MKLSGGKYWEVQEQALKTGGEICGCGRALATTVIGDESVNISGKSGLVNVCFQCKEKEEESFVDSD